MTPGRTKAAVAVILVLAPTLGAAQVTAPANTLHDLGGRLEACLKIGRSHDDLAVFSPDELNTLLRFIERSEHSAVGELARLQKENIRVNCLVPGWIASPEVKMVIQ